MRFSFITYVVLGLKLVCGLCSTVDKVEISIRYVKVKQ